MTPSYPEVGEPLDVLPERANREWTQVWEYARDIAEQNPGKWIPIRRANASSATSAAYGIRKGKNLTFVTCPVEVTTRGPVVFIRIATTSNEGTN